MPPKKSKITRSAASQKQRQTIDSLASITSPPKTNKTSKTKKSQEKQSSLELPEVKGIVAQVLAKKKQKKSREDEKSSSNNNSTGNKNALFVPQAKMAPFDTKLEHLLSTYCYAKSDKHEIWQAFVENNILTFDEFVDSHNLESLKEMKHTKGNTSIDAFSSGKLILVHKVLLYYNFLRQEGQAIEIDPTQLDKRRISEIGKAMDSL